MSIFSNAKAQASKLYTGAKQVPTVKGLKGILYEEGLKTKAQTKILNDINKESKNFIDILPSAYQDGREFAKGTVGADGGSIYGNVKASMDKVEKLGIGSLEEGNLKKFLNGRFKNNEDLLNLQNEAIINKAKVNSVIDGNTLKVIDDNKAKSAIHQSASEVDGQLAFMTPISMAKEYYGKPISNAIGNIGGKEYTEALKDVGVAGARVGASAGALVGATSLASGVASTTATAFDRLNNNNYGG